MNALYIAGPMTGIPDYNRPAFNRAAQALAHVGFEVINPAELDLGPDATWLAYMRAALCNLSLADGVALLPGWEHSRGARIERNAAFDLGLPVAYCAGWLTLRLSAPKADPLRAIGEPS